jgi:hypothetical protein
VDLDLLGQLGLGPLGLDFNQDPLLTAGDSMVLHQHNSAPEVMRAGCLSHHTPLRLPLLVILLDWQFNEFAWPAGWSRH